MPLRTPFCSDAARSHHLLRCLAATAVAALSRSVTASEMTDIVWGGALNSTLSSRSVEPDSVNGRLADIDEESDGDPAACRMG